MVKCPDRTGLVHAITGVLFRHGANILTNHEFVAPGSEQFFMRTEFTGGADLSDISNELNGLLPAGAEVRLSRNTRKRLVVFASKEPYCLGELLIQVTTGELCAEIVAVISNHNTLRPLVERFGLPFHDISHENRTRAEHEAEILEVVRTYRADWLVLARYMRVFSPEFVREFPDAIINIHHSFLPAFIGEKPYERAHRRGVKIIGATAHFVTDNLDEGPIINQDVIAVDHSYSSRDLALAGRAIEKAVLAKALRLVLEQRVFIFENRTVVFE